MKIKCKCGHSYADHDVELFCMKTDCDCALDRMQVIFNHITALEQALKQIAKCNCQCNCGPLHFKDCAPTIAEKAIARLLPAEGETR